MAAAIASAIVPVLAAMMHAPAHDAGGTSSAAPNAATADEWVDQRTAPIGHRRYLEEARRGAFPTIKVGRRVLCRREDFDRYLASRTRGASPEPSPSPAAHMFADLAGR